MGPAVIVHSRQDALTAAAVAAETGRPLILVSAPGAALAAGPAWFRALADAVAAHHPGAGIRCVLDCADAPGAALAAIRAGVRELAVEAGPAAPALAAIAAAAGVRLHAFPVAAADLRGEGDPQGALRRLLADA